MQWKEQKDLFEKKALIVDGFELFRVGRGGDEQQAELPRLPAAGRCAEMAHIGLFA